MNPDELINSALAGTTSQGEGIFILEGLPARNEFHMVPAAKTPIVLRSAMSTLELIKMREI
jgi:hypothetical protein